MKLAIIFLFFSFPSFGQYSLDQIEKDFAGTKSIQDLSNKTIQVSIQDVIEGGLRTNYAQQTRRYQFQLNEITFQDAFEDFYFPNINLNMVSIADHYVEDFYRDVDVNASSSRVPNGFIGIEMEDYALFNWGRDYLQYLNSKETYERAKQNLSEEKRDLRLSIISNYFSLARYKQITRILKKQLSHTSFIYRLAKEKLTLKKIKSQEFLEAKSLFLQAHRDYHQALYEYDQQQEVLTELLGEDNETAYNPTSQLKYVPIGLTPKESIKFAYKKNRKLLDAIASIHIANRSYEKTLKDNLPLPTFSVKLGTYQRNFTGGAYSDDYETFAGSKNVELAASLNATWRIVGSGGLMNRRTREASFYNKKIAELNLRDRKRQIGYLNRIIHSRIQRLEKRFKAVEAERSNARKVFDSVIDNYISGKTKITNVRQILTVLKNSSIAYETTKFNHLDEKVTLAQFMGVDDFPGEKFERMVEE